jgi:hypothetical protein
LVKEVKGSWEPLRKPGANRFLGLLAGLKWWREKLGVTKEWVAALEDVTWVLGMLSGKRYAWRCAVRGWTDDQVGL